MKTFFATAGCLFIFAGLSGAQDEQDYKGWMKTVGATAGSLRKEIAAKQGPEAAKDAQTLADTFEKVGAYWSKNNASDAVELAKTAHDSATDVAAAATAGDWDKAAASMKALGGTCGACHNAHREKLPEGGFKIKP